MDISDHGETFASCVLIPPLQGFSVGVTAGRRREEQGHLLERLGARVMYGCTLEVENVPAVDPLRAATERLIESPPDYLIATTAIGMRAWLTACETLALDDELIRALRATRVVARGPKSRGAVLQAGLDVWWQAPTEQLDEAVAHLLPTVRGATVAVQLYGREHIAVLDRLVAAGAHVVPVAVYRWTVPADTAPAARLLDAVLARRLDAVTFTSPPAVEHLFDLARRAGVGTQVVEALNGPVLAAGVGPVTAAALRAHGVGDPCAPATGRLGLMVREVASRLHAAHRHLATPDGTEVVIHGDTVVTPTARVTLPHRERRVLAVLARRAGSVVSRPRLLNEAWASPVESDAVDAAISRLRRSLAGSGLEITSVTRRGHVLTARNVACSGPASHGRPRVTSAFPVPVTTPRAM